MTTPEMPWSTEVCVIEGATRRELIDRTRAVSDALPSHAARGDTRLQDIAYGLVAKLDAASLERRPLRLAIVASSVDDLVAKLARAVVRLDDPECAQIRQTDGIYFAAEPMAREGSLALLFPGEGSPYADMLADLCIAFPVVRETFDLADRLHRHRGDAFVPSDFIFPRATGSPEDRRWALDRLAGMAGAVSAVLTADVALHRLLQALGLRADAMAGHSAGEQAALLAAGVYGAGEQGLSEVLMSFDAGSGSDAGSGPDERTDQGVLVVLGTDRAAAESLIRGAGLDAEVCIDNCPHQVIVALEEDGVAPLLDAARLHAVIAERLTFDHAYHTARFGAYSQRLRDALAGVPLHPPAVPVYSCATTRPFGSDREEIAELTAAQWSSPIEFRRTIERMYDDGVRLFVEVGPKGHLTAFVEDGLRGRRHVAVASNMPQRSGIAQIHHMLGLLMAHGVSLQLGYLHAHRSSKAVDPFEPAAGGATRAAGTAPLRLQMAAPDLRLPAGFALPSTPGRSPPDVAAFAGNDPTSVAHSFLRTMDRFLVVQSQVMRAYLDASGRAPPSAAPSVAVPMASHAAATQQVPVGARRLHSPLEVSEPRAGSTDPGATDDAHAAPSSGDGAAAPAAAIERPADLPDALRRIVADRTGYPPEIITLDADLEADLGIDSIKRVEILGTLRQSVAGLEHIDLELLTPQRTLRQMIDVLVANPVVVPGTPAANRTPSPTSADAFPNPRGAEELWGSVTEHQPGVAITVTQTFDPTVHEWLADHTFGRDVSRDDPDLPALAVLPLALAIELMAEAAQTLAPGRLIVRIEGVRAHRWVAFEAGPQTVQVRARATDDGPSRITVELWNVSDDVVPSVAGPAAEATVVTASEFAPAPEPLSATDAVEPARVSPDRFYEDVLFHGPTWQALRKIHGVGRRSARADIRTPDAEWSVGAIGFPSVLDPVAVDAGAQVFGCWASERVTGGRSMLPVAVEAIDVYRPRPRPGALLTCLLEATDVAKRTMAADFDLVDGGDVCLRVRGWTQRRFELPAPLEALALPGALGYLTEPLPVRSTAGADTPAIEVRTLLLEPTEHAAFLARVWSMRILSRRERQAHSTATTGTVQLARIALLHVAKEAVRALLQRTTGNDVLPADIELEAQGDATFFASGRWARPSAAPCTVWATHDGHQSLALAAADASAIANPLEVLRRLSRSDRGAEGSATLGVTAMEER